MARAERRLKDNFIDLKRRKLYSSGAYISGGRYEVRDQNRVTSPGIMSTVSNRKQITPQEIAEGVGYWQESPRTKYFKADGYRRKLERKRKLNNRKIEDYQFD